MKKVLLIVFIIIGLIVCALIFLPTNNNLSKSPNNNIPEENSSVDDPLNMTDAETISEINKSYAVGLLEYKTPYKGENFSLYFNTDSGKFILYLNPKNLDQGKQEFDGFLKSNKVESMTWFDNIFVTYITPTPTIGQITKPTP